MNEVQPPEPGPQPAAVTGSDASTDARVATFWEVARLHAKISGVPTYFGPTPLESVPPPAWSFGVGTPNARTTFRNWDLPIRRQIFSGFRCARSA